MLTSNDMTPKKCKAQSSWLAPSLAARHLQRASRDAPISRMSSKTTNGVAQSQTQQVVSALFGMAHDDVACARRSAKCRSPRTCFVSYAHSRCGVGELTGFLYYGFLGCIHSLRARAPPAAAACCTARALEDPTSQQANMAKSRTNGGPKRTGAHLRAMLSTRPAWVRWGTGDTVLRLSCCPPATSEAAINGR